MIPQTKDLVKIQKWFDKVIGRKVNSKISDRLFNKFKKQYDDFMERRKGR